MHTHPIETAAIAEAAHRGEGRFNFYASIHKALRAAMSEALLALGRADPAEEAEVHNACDQVVELMEMAERHVEHENQFIHPALRARCPGVCDEVASEHEQHVRHTAHLADAARALASVPPAQRPAALHALYLALALFVADNLQHMHSEETRHNAALWGAFDDLELIALHDALVASIPPAEMMRYLHWMLPSLNPLERCLLLNDMQEKAPPEALAAALDLARARLSERDWAKLSRGMNLPPVPGLVSA